MNDENLFRINPKGDRKLVASSGKYGLFETNFTLGRVSNDTKKEGRYIHVSNQRLLPERESQAYINLQTAERHSGLSEDELIELCESGVLIAKFEKRGWMILLDSLDEYLNR